MKIAISGTHYVGKSTIANDLYEILDNYAIYDEPYVLLEEEGHEFSFFPTIDEYILQLEKSLELISSSDENNVIFDRCPIDILAYIMAQEDTSYDFDSWQEQIIEANNNLDLIIFIPIENPDIIYCPESNDRILREVVNNILKELIYKNIYTTPVLEINGNNQKRITQILKYLSNSNSQ